MTEPRLFLWAAEGSPDLPPGRVEVSECPTCAALIVTERLDRHAVSHRADRRKGTA